MSLHSFHLFLSRATGFWSKVGGLWMMTSPSMLISIWRMASLSKSTFPISTHSLIICVGLFICHLFCLPSDLNHSFIKMFLKLLLHTLRSSFMPLNFVWNVQEYISYRWLVLPNRRRNCFLFNPTTFVEREGKVFDWLWHHFQMSK